MTATQSFTISVIKKPVTYEVSQPGSIQTDPAGRRYRHNRTLVLDSQTNLLLREYEQYDYNV